MPMDIVTKLGKSWNVTRFVLTVDGEQQQSITYAYSNLNGIFAQTDANGTSYLFKNVHGDTVIIVRNGSVVDEATYNPYGNPKESQEVTPYTYANYYYDSNLGLYYLRNRYYDPSIGRFISEDPINDGNNWYVYCGGNPVGFVDPSGYWAEPYTDENGIYHSNPDYEEFGGTIVYQALSDLTESYDLCKTDEERKIAAELANEVRRIGRSFLEKLTIYEGTTFDSYYQLNSTEIVLANGHYYGFTMALYTGYQSSNMTADRYGSSWGIANEIDAYRHGTWSMLLAYNTSPEFARMWLSAHEFGTPDNLKDLDTEHGSTRYEQTKMDLFNNSVGIYQASILNRTYVFKPNGYFAVPLTEDVDRVITSRINAGGMSILN